MLPNHSSQQIISIVESLKAASDQDVLCFWPIFGRRSKFLFCNLHSNPFRFNWGHQCSRTLTSANNLHTVFWLEQEVTRPRGWYKPTWPENQSGANITLSKFIIKHIWTGQIGLDRLNRTLLPFCGFWTRDIFVGIKSCPKSSHSRYRYRTYNVGEVYCY